MTTALSNGCVVVVDLPASLLTCAGLVNKQYWLSWWMPQQPLSWRKTLRSDRKIYNPFRNIAEYNRAKEVDDRWQCTLLTLAVWVGESLGGLWIYRIVIEVGMLTAWSLLKAFYTSGNNQAVILRTSDSCRVDSWQTWKASNWKSTLKLC